MEKFKRVKHDSRVIFERGDDTVQNPHMEIHAPCERIAAADSWLLYFVNPLERQFLTQSQRGKWLKFKSYRAAVKYANSIVY